MRDFLQQVREVLPARVSAEVAAMPEPRRRLPLMDFKRAIDGEGVALIAEYKRASPSGHLRLDLDPWNYAKAVSQYAAAFSVLTEPLWFLGDYRYIAAVKMVGNRPVMMKDFVAYREQILMGWAAGADAVLLIYRLVGDNVAELAEYAEKRLGMSVVVEVWNEKEVDAVLDVYPNAIIGVNARDLATLNVSFQRALEVVRYAAKRASLVIAESGISTASQVIAAARAGAKAVLVGTALMRDPRLAAKLAEAGRFEAKYY